jgi:deoxyribonuclease-4
MPLKPAIVDRSEPLEAGGAEGAGAAEAGATVEGLVATGMTTIAILEERARHPIRGCALRNRDLKRCKAHAVARKLFTQTQMPLLFGAHTIDTGGIDMAALRAGNAGMSALQIFTAIPKYYGDKQSIRPERIDRFRAALETAGIAAEHVVVHAAYVLNTATADDEKWTRARDGLAKELERSTALGVGAVCFHPGAATGHDRESAAKRVAKAITHALKTVKGATRLLIENTAGAGLTMGRTPEEIGMMLADVPDTLRERTGFGLDTCHLFAAGHDIRASRAAFTKVIDEFEAAAGGAPSFFHLNDSEGALGSNKDRHVLIGDGAIGREPFEWLLADKRAKKVPLILETPQLNYEIADDDATPDPFDVQMLELLEGMAGKK